MALIASLTSGVAAMRSFVRGMEVIGNNVANANTIGFKGSRTQYSDTFSNILQRGTPAPDSDLGSNGISTQIGTGVKVAVAKQSFTQGGLNTTGVTTDLGISGEGFFRVKDTSNFREYVTRAGDFRLDDRGFLVTNQGYRIQGLATGSIRFDVTLDGNNRLVFTKAAYNVVPPSDAAFNDQLASKPGVHGTVGDLRINYDISDTDAATGSTKVFLASDVADPGNEFDGNDVVHISYADAILTATNPATGQLYTDADIRAQAPSLLSYSINEFGTIFMFLSNGDSFERGRLLLQDFRDPSALLREGENLYSGLDAAGPKGGVNLTEPNNSPNRNGLGRIISGSLEISNVDLTNEFSEMITTQRAFQAGSRIITVSDQLLEEIVNLKR